MDNRQAPAVDGLPADDPHRPISPPDAVATDSFALPVYLSNGLIGLRLIETPLGGGVAMLNGFVGEHPEEAIEAAARAPFPLNGDLAIDGLRLSQSPHLVGQARQGHDFATGEVVTHGTFRTSSGLAQLEVVVFCCRTRPTIMCQEIRLTVEAECQVELAAGVDARGVYGREGRQLTDPGKLERAEIDGGLRWHSHGEVASCGLAYVTELLGAEDAEATLERREQMLQTTRLRRQAGAHLSPSTDDKRRLGRRASPAGAAGCALSRDGRPRRIRHSPSREPGRMAPALAWAHPSDRG